MLTSALPEMMNLVTGARDRRRMVSLAAELQAGRVALLVGAGADMALAGTADWPTLVSKLLSGGGAYDAVAMSALIRSWPAETALVARNLLGKRRYLREIKNATEGARKANVGLRKGLGSLAKFIPLVVTTNYSPHVREALLEGRDGKNVYTLDRRTLKSIRSLEPVAADDPEKRPTLIVHIHGRADDIVLDQRSYDDAQFDDALYARFLEALFEHWTVLAIGFSFSDVPIRMAAAKVRHVRPNVRRTHVWIDKRIALGPRKPRVRAAMHAYATHLVEVAEYDDVGSTISSLSALATSNIVASAKIHAEGGRWQDVVRILEASGDYESLVQKQLFHGPDGVSVREMAERLIHEAGISWEIVARLERHLRHHLWLVDRKLRADLWNHAAQLLVSRPTAADHVPNELVRDFVIGFHEVTGEASYQSIVAEIGARLTCTDADRVRMASELWRSPSALTLEALESLRVRAADAGWEAIEARIGFDLVRSKIQEVKRTPSPRALRPSDIDEVLSLCDDAREAAQIAGAERRQIGVTMCQGLWTPVRNDARSVLRAAIDIASRETYLESTVKLGLAFVWSSLFDSPVDALAEVGWQDVDPGEIERQRAYWLPLQPPWSWGPGEA